MNRVRYAGVALTALLAIFVTYQTVKAQTCVPVNGVVNVVLCGAAGNGTTDDTSAINAAVAAVQGTAEFGVGGTVYFPPGTYLVSDRIHITGHNIKVLGSVGKASHITTTSTFGEKAVFHFGQLEPTYPQNSIQFPSVQGISIQLNDSESIGIFGYLTRNLTVQDSNIEGPDSSTSTVGILLDGSCQLVNGACSGDYYSAFTNIRGNYIQRVHYGIQFRNQVTRTWIANNTIVGRNTTDLDYGVYAGSTVTNGVFIEGNSIESWRDGIHSLASGLTIVGNVFEHNSRHHVNFAGDEGRIARSWLLGNSYFGTHASVCGPSGTSACWLVGFPGGVDVNPAASLIVLLDVDTHFDAPWMDLVQLRGLTMSGRAAAWCSPGSAGTGYRALCTTN
jgi:pectate lyase-like protein